MVKLENLWFLFIYFISEKLYVKLKFRVLESDKTRPGPEFHSASIGVILSFRIAILELATLKYYQ